MNKKNTLISVFRGLDQNTVIDDSGELSPDMLNFSVDDKYRLKKREGYRVVASLSAPVRAMWSGTVNGNKMLVYISGGVVYKYDPFTEIHTQCGVIEDGVSSVFEFDGRLYIINGVNYYSFDGTEINIVEGYIPILTVATSPSGAGTLYEQVNMLTDKRRQLFSSTFNDRVFQLAETGILEIVYVKVNGTITNQYETFPDKGNISFFTPPPAGINNVEICYRMPLSNRSRITSNTYSVLFGSNADTRVFLWGNPTLPSYRFHSELADGVPSAEYFPENNYTSIGNTKITDIVQQYDRQLIFTPESAYYSYCEVRTDSLGNLFSSFPVYSLHSSKGNLLFATGCTIDGKPVTLCRDGINIWESTNVENEKNAVCFSAPIANTIRDIDANDHYSLCTLFDRQSNSELYFSYLSRLYIYNYSLNVWYVYDGINASCFNDFSGDLYIGGNDNKIYTFDKAVKSHSSYWVSPFMSFGDYSSKKDILSLTVSAYCTSAGSLSAEITDEMENDQNKVSTVFPIEYGNKPYYYQNQLRTVMRRISSARLKLGCGNGDDVCISRLNICTAKKGAVYYGV